MCTLRARPRVSTAPAERTPPLCAWLGDHHDGLSKDVRRSLADDYAAAMLRTRLSPSFPFLPTSRPYEKGLPKMCFFLPMFWPYGPGRLNCFSVCGNAPLIFVEVNV